jgi:hypothetical protein
VLQQTAANNYERDAPRSAERYRPSWCYCADAGPGTPSTLTSHANLRVCWRHCAYRREPDYAQELPV